RVPDEDAVERGVVEAALLERRRARRVALRPREVRRVFADVEALNVPAPLARDVEEAADVAADLEDGRGAAQQRPNPRLARAKLLDVRAQHLLHDVRLVRIAPEAPAVASLPLEDPAAAAVA